MASLIWQTRRDKVSAWYFPITTQHWKLEKCFISFILEMIVSPLQRAMRPARKLRQALPSHNKYEQHDINVETFLILWSQYFTSLADDLLRCTFFVSQFRLTSFINLRLNTSTASLSCYRWWRLTTNMSRNKRIGAKLQHEPLPSKQLLASEMRLAKVTIYRRKRWKPT